MKFFSRHAVASALAAMVGCGAFATAQAGVLASSILELSNFKIQFQGAPLTNVPTNNPYVTIVSGNNFGTNLADLTSVAGAAVNTASVVLIPAGGQFDLASVCQGDCPTALAENNFSSVPTPPVANFARSDNRVQGAAISLDLNGDGTIDVPAGVTASARSDVSLIDSDIGTATSSTGTNTSFDFFVTGGPVNLTIDFDYLAYVYTLVDPGSALTSTATGGTTWNLRITGPNGSNVLTWDPTQLNLSASRSDANLGVETAGSLVTGSLTNTFSLANNTRYQLSITHLVQANAQLTEATQVPEPGSLALVGLALAGMGGAAARRRKLSAQADA
jgi:hypothetical protein